MISKIGTVKRLFCMMMAIVLMLLPLGCVPNQPTVNQTQGSSAPETSAPVFESDPTDPTDTDPTDTDPTDPSQTDPTDPEPTDPEPTDPEPTDPKPTDPKPENTDFVIVKDGKAAATIVIAKDYTNKTLAAATDLQVHIQKMTGVTVKIGFDNVDRSNGNFILVGPTKYTTQLGIKQPKGYPNNERIIVKRIENYLVLIGNDDAIFKGTQFAVTAFLEELGCGWFGTRELWQVVPEKKSIVIDELDIDITPKFISRRNRLLDGYEQLGERWYLGGAEVVTGGHYLPTLISTNEFAAHPDWFATRNGEIYREDGIYWQYCYTNAELAVEFGKRITAYFDNNPYCISYTITANDGWVMSTCQCATCNSYSNDSDIYVLFANRIAREVAKKYPDRMLSFLAYHSTLKAPSKSVALEPNVDIMFCAETTMTRPIAKAEYIGMAGTKTNIPWRVNFEEYVNKTGAQHLSVWKWYCIAAESEAWSHIPWVQGNVAIEDQNFWKKNGVAYVFYDQGPLGGYREYESSIPLRWPLWYVAAKGAWNPDLTGDEILMDACEKLYGKAADAMFAYYKALATASEECTADSHAWAGPKPSAMYTSAQISKIDKAVAEAKKLMSKVSSDEKARMENQLGLWEDAKAYIWMG